MSASSIQLAMAMGVIANGGKLMRPFVVKAITDQQGNVVKENQPTVIRQVIPPEVARKVVRVLERVVIEGTGPEAAIAGFRVAGKTGTSQKVDPKTKKYSKKNYVALFVGLVPAEKFDKLVANNLAFFFWISDSGQGIKKEYTNIMTRYIQSNAFIRF